MPIIQALKAIFANWYVMLHSEIANITFYKKCLGTDNPIINIFFSSKAFLSILMVVALMSAIDLFCGRSIADKRYYIPTLIILCLIAIPMVICVHTKMLYINKTIIGPSLNLISLTFIGVTFILYMKSGYNTEAKMKYAQMMIWSVFGLTLLFKIILNPRVYGYGFVLAVPATLGLIISFLWLIPSLLNQLFGRGNLFRLFSVIGLTAFVLVIFISNDKYNSRKNQLIGKGFDSFLVSDSAINAHAINSMIAFIESSIPAQESLVVLPEGAMFNYLTRHASSIPIISFTPGEIAVFGETYILNSLKKQPPDFILLAHRSTKIFDKGFFGTDPTYGKQIMDWVKENYLPILLMGAEPLKNDNFGLKLLKFRPNLKQ
jgi:hypothetical protein